MNAPRPTRRELLGSAAVVGGGLLLGFGFGDRLLAAEMAAAEPFGPNPFLRIGADGVITVIAKHDEMGQGIHTTLAMCVAEELEADWTKVRVEPAPANEVYNHTAFGSQMTGGSSSTWSAYEQMRKAGAAAREMLVAAAAARWQVDPASCTAAKSAVSHPATKRRAAYGELVTAAAKLPVPQEPKLKDPKDFQIIGKKVHRVDSRDKVLGKAVFSLDTEVPGMLVAVVARSPYFGGTLRRFDASRAKAMAGVKAVVQVPSGVAVVAEKLWQARQARAALTLDWDAGPGAGLDSEALRADYTTLAAAPGVVAKKEGDANAALGSGAKVLEALYEVPFLAHAPMEPLSCLVTLNPPGMADGAEIWAGSQMLGFDRLAAAKALGVEPKRVSFKNTYLGGGFGRRASPKQDWVIEAVQVAKAARFLGAPIKTVWTREDDIQGGFYRPMWANGFSAALDASGNLVAWRHRIVGQSIAAGTPFEAFLIKDGIDGAAIEGAADLPYAVPNLLVELHTTSSPIPVQWWRSVGHSNTGFAVEGFLDEVAVAAGKDPYEFRRALLASHPRHLKVLDLAAKQAGWGKPLAPGMGRGIAVHESFGSFVAQVAEVSLDPATGGPRVHRVVAAIDCGPVVNPDAIRAQLEGGIVFALSAVLHSEITLQGGKVKQSNFHDYEVLRMHEAPRIEVVIADSTDKMGGVGEVGVPPVAAAVANAFFAATGKRVRRLPIRA